MSAQGRACIVPPSSRRCSRVVLLLLLTGILGSCGGHQASLDSFRFRDDAPLEIVQVIDRNTIAVADGLSGDLVNDLDGLTPVSVSVRSDYLLVSDLRSGRIIRMEDDNIEVQGGIRGATVMPG